MNMHRPPCPRMIKKNHQAGKRVNWFCGIFFVILWSAALIICTLRLPEHDGGLKVSTADVSAQPPAGAAEPGMLLRSTIDAKESIVEELYRSVSPERLAKLAHVHRDHYKNASPFPHIAIDNIFPNSILQKVIEEHPESDLGPNGCLIGMQCFKAATENLKSAVEREEFMGLYTRILFSFLKSSVFISFLEGLTGISNIIPDPHFRGSGLHFRAPGGNLNIHADFNRYKYYKLDRRVNLFIYLNNDWPDEYGGHLDLWSRDMKTCYERIAPKLGRLVVFSSTDFSYHGHPEPITAPKGRARRSMALYYYTNGRPIEECLKFDCTNKHSTLFQKPVGCEKCLDDTCRRETTLSSPIWMAN